MIVRLSRPIFSTSLKKRINVFICTGSEPEMHLTMLLSEYLLFSSSDSFSRTFAISSYAKLGATVYSPLYSVIALNHKSGF